MRRTTIMLDEAFDLFAEAAPATVMIRAVLEGVTLNLRIILDAFR